MNRILHSLDVSIQPPLPLKDARKLFDCFCFSSTRSSLKKKFVNTDSMCYCIYNP